MPYFLIIGKNNSGIKWEGDLSVMSCISISFTIPPAHNFDNNMQSDAFD